MDIIDVNNINKSLVSFGFYPLLLTIFFVGMFIFWRESKLVAKNRSSIFDLYFISGFVALLWGRISYILANLSEFVDLPWFLFPYEKYVDGVYVFRLLPWRYFRVWDGGILFTGLFVGFSIAAFIYSIWIKKWNWREMMSSVVLSSNVMFALTLFAYGGVIKDQTVADHGIYLFELSLIYVIVANLIRMFVKKLPELKKRLFDISVLIYSLSVSWYLYRLFISNDMSEWDVINTQAFGIVMLLFIVVYILSMTRKKNISIESVSSVHSVDISANKAISVSVLDRRGKKGE